MCILETPVTESWNPLQEAHQYATVALVDREEFPELCDSYLDVVARR
jgi:hypothetical protein